MTHNVPPSANAFRRDVLARRRLIGCWASLCSAIAIEILGDAGFDWLLIDAEHAPNDLNTILQQLFALKASTSAPVVRPASTEPVELKRLLDLGVNNFLMPFMESAEHARAVVAATRYPPRGTRGISAIQRASRYGYANDYFERVDDNICVMAQIENRSGLDAARDIAAVDGIDALFIGPSDLSAALGHFGNPQHPEVQAAMSHVLESALAHGKAVGILSTAVQGAQHYLNSGMTCVAVGMDLLLLRNASRELRQRFAHT